MSNKRDKYISVCALQQAIQNYVSYHYNDISKEEFEIIAKFQSFIHSKCEYKMLEYIIKNFVDDVPF